ncbi:MAG: MogA/MoaB family molybdenum cofactor biosynthesis protein [Chloroflexi bacterium]|nr:MogA/MoaB family molybdenum cofactor biosynthesis protein [Chloroflexota bacterium]
MTKAAVITISDRGFRGERTEDLSGQEIEKALKDIGIDVAVYRVIPDEKIVIAETLTTLVDDQYIDLILTTGGTGLGPRDVTPEATLAVIDREVPGIPTAMLIDGLTKTPRAMLSRAVAGVRRESLIVNLPGSPKAVREGLAVVIPVVAHALAIIKGQPTDH